MLELPAAFDWWEPVDRTEDERLAGGAGFRMAYLETEDWALLVFASEEEARPDLLKAALTGDTL